MKRQARYSSLVILTLYMPHELVWEQVRLNGVRVGEDHKRCGRLSGGESEQDVIEDESRLLVGNCC